MKDGREFTAEKGRDKGHSRERQPRKRLRDQKDGTVPEELLEANVAPAQRGGEGVRQAVAGREGKKPVVEPPTSSSP